MQWYEAIIIAALTIVICIQTMNASEQNARIADLYNYADREYERGVRDMACVAGTNDLAGCLLGTTKLKKEN